ncbi:DDB1- and CUL4-associated factor 8 [Dinochytrium kinnereticum]|nr:DDB1- and CUL4-associated factor 8 [Dinochytrium kinnereticum]
MAIGCSDGYIRTFDRRFMRPPGWDWEDASAVDELQRSQVYKFRPSKFNDTSRRHKITCVSYDPSGSGDILASYSGEKVYVLKPSYSNSERSADDMDIIRAYSGHRNERTIIKEACFYGGESQYIMSGSDDGRLYVWSKSNSKLINVVKCDKSIVNCIAPNPFDPLIAVSGIDHDVKILLPIASKPWDATELKILAPEDSDEDSDELPGPYANNQLILNFLCKIGTFEKFH